MQDEVASHHSQELEEGSNESCCGSEVRLADQKADQQEKDDHLWDLKQRIAHVGKVCSLFNIIVLLDVS